MLFFSRSTLKDGNWKSGSESIIILDAQREGILGDTEGLLGMKTLQSSLKSLHITNSVILNILDPQFDCDPRTM